MEMTEQAVRQILAEYHEAIGKTRNREAEIEVFSGLCIQNTI